METVMSADGTVIAYDCAGDGPALIVSVGAFCTRQAFVAPDTLQQCFTVVTYDRRGRGDSGDTQPFAPEREYEDLVAVAAATGPEPPFLFGHSSDAAIALRAAAAGLPTAGIVAYEAPFLNLWGSKTGHRWLTCGFALCHCPVQARLPHMWEVPLPAWLPWVRPAGALALSWGSRSQRRPA